MTTFVDPVSSPAKTKRKRKGSRRSGKKKSRRLHVAGCTVLVAGLICTAILTMLQCGLTFPPSLSAYSEFNLNSNAAIVETARPAHWWQFHYLGCAYFVGCLAAWQLFTYTGTSKDLRWVVRIGAVASVAILGALMLSRQGPVLWWVAQVVNLAFWALVEISPKPPVKEREFMPSVTVLAVFAVLASAFIVRTTNHRWSEREAIGNDGSYSNPAITAEASPSLPQ